jgi:hypothetical protein
MAKKMTVARMIRKNHATESPQSTFSSQSVDKKQPHGAGRNARL